MSGSPVRLQAAKVRIILASLLLRPNKSVSTDELSDRLWGEDPPKGVRSALQTYINRLRNALGPASHLIRTDSTGYRIELPAMKVDLGLFRADVAKAQEAKANGDLQSEGRALRDALSRWRGLPLADVPSPSLQIHEVPRLIEERLRVVERRIDVDLELARHTDLVGELRGLTVEHPHRERFWFQLMTVLYRSDRQAEALAAYDHIRTLLREELGIDPGHQLRGLYQQILTADQAHITPVPVDRWRPPFQVPPDVSDFVGRAGHLDKIATLVGAGDGPRPAVPVVILSGPPGAGKTALAIHAAHRLRMAFPDGQLYLNMHGYSTRPPMTAGDALERFLRTQLSPEMIPHDLDEKASVFRSLLADRRVLIVLDNVQSADQVRPLLPGAPTSAVFVTSRDNLLSLSALNGARRVPVGMISPHEATALLARILGPERVAAESAAIDAIAERCGYLPLALRIVAANLTALPGMSVESMVQQMRGDRLAAMKIEGDDEAAVCQAFELSYRTLKPELARLFSLLSMVPGPHFDRYVAAGLADCQAAEAQRMLERLAATNLIYSSGSGQFRFHDLIRDYAQEQMRFAWGERPQRGERPPVRVPPSYGPCPMPYGLP
ncbi:BTAD domain-containing putative transcriptional regulator [Sphaerisporangium sp. B11E5]|uniref:AfsR/SARP family transcriptional regulator n=1 Tax=Sphaerisporangium sp. B11E5 TaxID=3153563 RepID=UPI00325DCBCC